MAAPASGSPRHHDVEPRSPWIAQLEPDGPARPLASDLTTDVVVVGAGIAGVSTAFFVLRQTDLDVVLLERWRVARGATGRNAGQLTTYFERPLWSIAEQFGEPLAVEAQHDVDGAHELLDLMAGESAAGVRVERFVGHMGMFTLNHLMVHLRNNAIRRRGGIGTETIVVSEDASFLADIPSEYDGLWSVVPQARIHELLETDDSTYCAVLSDRKGCGNSGLLTQQVLAHLVKSHPGRFRYHDETPVDRLTVAAHHVTASSGARTVRGRHLVLCTNGFTDHELVDVDGDAIELVEEQRVSGVVGFMAAFLEEHDREPTAMSFVRNTRIGDGQTPYVYVTRRTYDRPEGTATLTCMGGPERPLDEERYDPSLPVPGRVLDEMDDAILPFAQPARPANRPYDFQWHGLMGYMDGMVRVVGRHPEHSSLLYNLGCNGVGFLPSIYGGHRVARLLGGEALGPSIFDPRTSTRDGASRTLA